MELELDLGHDDLFQDFLSKIIIFIIFFLAIELFRIKDCFSNKIDLGLRICPSDLWIQGANLVPGSLNVVHQMDPEPKHCHVILNSK